MKMRNPVSIFRIVFLTVAAIVLADLVAIALQWSWQAPPPTTVVARKPEKAAVPESVEQVVADTRSLLKDAPQPASSPTASPSPMPGQAGSGGGPGVPAGAEAPDPSQTMTLLGTMVSDAGSVAFVQVGGNTMTLYHGSTINGFVVHDIRGNSVVLTYAGTPRTLFLPSLQPTPVASPGGPNRGGLLPPPPAPVASSPTPVDRDGKVVLAKSEVMETLSHPEAYMKEMRILPYTKDNKPFGMRVMYLQPGSLLNKMGVQAGDIIVSLNGQNMFTVEDAMTAYKTIEKEDHVAFQVERQGKMIPLEVDIR